LSVDERIKLIDEEPRFIVAVLASYPASVIAAALGNAARQLVQTSPTEAWVDPGDSFGDPLWRNASLFQVAPFLDRCVTNVGSCITPIPETFVAPVVVATTLLSLAIILVHFIRRFRYSAGAENSLHNRAALFAVLILVGLIVNAVICGAISGPHPR